MKQNHSRIFSDVSRYGILLGVVGALLIYADPANIVVFHALGIGLFLVGGTHLTRRILLPRLDLQEIAIAAVREGNMAAALVFAAIIALLIAVMFLSVTPLR